jgi:6-pyruvoyltetrahydropterin/6-carboxytetrahydropterin synthase
MATAFLTRETAFSAAHRYHRPDWTDERNRAVFGACNNPHGHGHNYRLVVTVEGSIDPETGFSADLGVLDALLRDVVAPLDHQHLNHAVPEFRDGGRIPTSENILLYLWPRIASGVASGMTSPEARLHRLRLYEDATLYVDYFGDAAKNE